MARVAPPHRPPPPCPPLPLILIASPRPAAGCCHLSAAPLLRVRHLSPRHGPDVRISNGGRTCRVHQGARRDHLTLPRDDHHPRPPARPAPPWTQRRRGGVRPPSTVLPLPTLRLAYRCPVLENSSITCHRSVCTRTISAATRRSRRRLCCTMSAPSYLFCAPLPHLGSRWYNPGFRTIRRRRNHLP